MKVALLIIALVLLLLFCPTHIVFRYIGNELHIYVRLWYVFKLTLYPRKKKDKVKEDRKKTEKQKVKIDISAYANLEKIGLIFKIIKQSLRLFCKYFKIYRFSVSICVAGDDPADVATQFGLVNAAAYGLYAYLENTFRMGNKDIRIGFDYEKETTEFVLDIRFRVILIKFLFMLIYTNFRDILNVIQSTETAVDTKQEVK